MGIEKNVLKTGDKAALLGIGSGLNCLMMGIEW
jgi:3-oxoacyl-[acyl-carrier-protein] synthase-3